MYISKAFNVKVFNIVLYTINYDELKTVFKYRYTIQSIKKLKI